MSIPTEPVGSLPRPASLQAAIADYDAGKITKAELEVEQNAACLDSIKRMEATGSPINSDGNIGKGSERSPAPNHPQRRRRLVRQLWLYHTLIP